MLISRVGADQGLPRWLHEQLSPAVVLLGQNTGGRGSCYDCRGIIAQTSMKIPGRIQDNGDPQS